ncbi:MAG: HNH endonuclease [Nitrosomonadales bacterium]|nr:HNH endonuclease [Nitrosomonadales bacterium]
MNDTAPVCAICGGYLHVNSITTGHIERKLDGGSSNVINGQLAHPYCNSTYKH